MHPVQPLVEAFDREHGQHGPPVYHNQRIYFADGAWRDQNPLGIMAPPDAYRGPFGRRGEVEALIVRYWDIRLKQTTAEAKRFKKHLQDHVGTETDDNLKKLRAMAEEVRTCQLGLADAQEALEAVRPTPGPSLASDTLSPGLAPARLAFLAEVESVEV